ncbi:hypothetical protein B0A80_20425 [Flavobacterium tructae]|uniref:helix-turn-helix domain-containing protein n=1 Tax=Flavobacterium tructae TaxID=1114873 RepID=UPI000B5C1847|nr:helix-turn-helix domain-containing protein [Flavobacterium tructae]OXB18869.1 hypothetical protein B0A80_20425 [Flavobacterium tructae]
MENHQNLSFEKMPQILGKLVEEFSELKTLLTFKTTQESREKKLSMEMAIKVMAEEGVEISKSKLYKLTSSKQIPFYRFNQRLVFERSELIDWINEQIKSSNQSNNAIEFIAKSANNKLSTKRNGN